MLRRLSHALFVSAVVVSVPGGCFFGLWLRGAERWENLVVTLAAVTVVLLAASIVTHPALWVPRSRRR
jgi:hypothetical protein